MRRKTGCRAEMQGEIVALVHSHPGGLPWLSEADRRLQIKSALPWWLVCRGEIHKFRCVPHLTGRRFEHGVTDCYTLFRDAYHLAGITLPDFVREDDWWRNGRNLYLDNMAATGFTGCPCPLHRRAISCCAALAHRWPIMPPYTAATVNCFTICLNN